MEVDTGLAPNAMKAYERTARPGAQLSQEPKVQSFMLSAFSYLLKKAMDHGPLTMDEISIQKYFQHYLFIPQIILALRLERRPSFLDKI